MTSSSISCRERQPLGATPDPKNGGIKTSHWFWGAVEKLKAANSSPQKKAVISGESSDGYDELNEIVLENPQISGPTLINMMRSRGLAVSKITEAWSRRVGMIRESLEGGPGSGRKPGDGKKVPGVDKGAKTPPVETISQDVFDISLTPEQVATARDKFGSLPKMAYDKKLYDKDEQSKRAHDLELATRKRAKKESFADRLRGKGWPKPKKTTEAASASTVAQLTREAKFSFRPTNLRESATDDGVGPIRFKCVLLQEGLGNFGDAYYYDRPALESAIPLFTGVKIFADHPTTTEEQTRPERSVRDVLGHFENIQIESDKTGRGQLTGEVMILPDPPFEWARSLMRHAIDHGKKFPNQSFVGLSINASGDANESPIDDVLGRAPESAKPKLIEAKEKGIQSVRVVSKIKDALSCDLVTTAGAGGAITGIAGEL